MIQCVKFKKGEVFISVKIKKKDKEGFLLLWLSRLYSREERKLGRVRGTQ